ncbi:MAG: DUF1499 domain-containing protein [Alphaproteobacteria bacterium]|nr:DUF1499 domain-containing protein [Alphaproteobacteria bacterium]
MAGHFVVLAFVLVVVSAGLLAVGPIGWRVGWWHFRVAFTMLMPWAFYSGVAAAAVAFLILLFGRSRLEGRRVAIALLAFVAGGLVAYMPWHYDRLRQTLPPIHDITTDPTNPPAFSAVVPLREAAGPDRVNYEGDKVAAQQRQAYPDIVPLMLTLPPTTAFNRALDAAKAMGWTIVAADDAGGRIEASDRSRWFGFTDDIVIRVTPAGSGSRVDLRSSSRVGRSDFGVNAARIGRYLQALRAAASAG